MKPNNNTFVVNHKMPLPSLSNEYIRGLVEGEGCFTFEKNRNGKKVPAFVIMMHERDRILLIAMRKHLGLTTNIYWQKPNKSDGVNRGATIRIMIRGVEELKNIIVPFFYKKLKGYKGIQFNEWMEKMGNDPDVYDRYKPIYHLYKSGYWDKNPKFLD